MSETDIKILIIEPADQAQQQLIKILESDEHLRVLGIVESAAEALRFISRTKPDLITVDISLPGADGLSFTREIMETNPIPIVVIGSAETDEATHAFDMLKAGALATVEKPVAGLDSGDDTSRRLIETIKTMAEIKLVRRIRHRQGKGVPSSFRNSGQTEEDSSNSPLELVAIGASTGGPGVIQQILRGLPKDFPSPILIAQHIAPGFTDALVHWLSSTTGFDVRICNDNDKLEPSVAYLCPEGFQTGISNNLRVKLAEDDCMNGVRPSVSYLFASMSEIAGKRFAAILLTGMGRDGAEELKILRDCGSTVTIVQDAETSLVHGMPGEAIKLGAAQHVVSPQKIVEILLDLACAKRRQSGD
ncbi:chemotaxis protein CheB [Candidatus Obscuribacterales bacterium]|nr:chemotaxis protein CheB [Candidatus Obscuribacterales bacterium]MBX3134622.1 chemotaxis protein CheB [Candidatus Obscuribacterales bacterium]MBX3149993.1 chemotaxis protein CheB [Candidatus Obscuribacterales bacterium]